MMIGGALAGLAGDRFGRRTALLSSVALFGAMTIAIAFADGLAALGALRFVAGVGLGGALPNAAALAAEYASPRLRPVAVTITIVCVPLGATIAGLLGIRVLEIIGWRALFIAGGVAPLVLAGTLRFLLPESPLFQPRRPAQRQHPVREIVGPALRRDTLALWGAFFSCLLTVYLCFSWLPTLLNGAGFSQAFANTGISAFNLGGVAGALAGSVVIARRGSRVPMLAMAAGAILGAGALAATPLVPASATLVLVLLTLTGGLINAVQTTMYALATHVYPSGARATGVGAATAVGRLGSVASGYTGAWVLSFAGSAAFFGLLAGAMGACLLALAVVQRHIKGGVNQSSTLRSE
jgi:AAHS family 4-hydroxybenzoate transporter-like MFS transporter